MKLAREMDTINEAAGDRSDEEGESLGDFMTEWPQSIQYMEEATAPRIALPIIGFFMAPIVAPFCCLGLLCHHSMKMHKTWFGRYIVTVASLSFAAIIVNWSMFILLLMDHYNILEHTLEEVSLDIWGPLEGYLCLYVWYVVVLMRHFMFLTADKYDHYPKKLRLLRGVEFEPPVLQPATELPCRDVPSLVHRIWAISDLTTGAAHDPEGSEAASDVYTNCGEDESTTMDASCPSSDDDSLEDIEGKGTMQNRTWMFIIMASFLVALLQGAITHNCFDDAVTSDSSSGSSGSSASAATETTLTGLIISLSAISQFVTAALINLVVIALLMIYYRQLNALRHFSEMTSFFEESSSRHCRVVIDIRSTRNVLLWHEARTYVVDQIMLPNSFLRTVCDPTCALMLLFLLAGGAYVMMFHFFLLIKIDKVSFLVIWNTVFALSFFYVITSFTRKIMRTLHDQISLLTVGKLQVLEELRSRMADKWGRVQGTPEEIADAERLAKVVFGPAFCKEVFLDDAAKGRKAWRQGMMRMNAWRKRQTKTAEELRRAERMLEVLEPVFFANTITKSAWEAVGDSVSTQGPSYLVPPCGTASCIPPVSVHLNPLEAPHRKKAEIYRRMRVLESVVIHAEHRSVKPNILGIVLQDHLFVVVVVSLTLNLVLLTKLTMAEETVAW
eukprot:Rhum_TRINITY_DN15612_c0_g1::Rhum_TRINITY_DN15612_c0_g1_i1::g.161661::m.161661